MYIHIKGGDSVLKILEEMEDLGYLFDEKNSTQDTYVFTYKVLESVSFNSLSDIQEYIDGLC